jgi:UDP-glucose 4-epimerase
MRVLVTGGAGCIGSELCEELLARGSSVTIFDNFSSGTREHVSGLLGHPACRLIEADVLDRAALDGVMGEVDMVFHLAANPDVRYTPGQPTDKDLQLNMLATHSVLESMRLHGVRKLAFTSTSAVYGLAPRLPIGERDFFPQPISLYGATKLACEALISAFSHLFGMQCWIFRLANIVGARQRRYGKTVISDLIGKLRQDPRRLLILGDGQQEKSYLATRDCVEGMLFAVERSREQLAVLNLGGGDTITVARIAEMIVEAMGLQGVEFEYTGTEGGWPGDVPRFVLDVTAINRLGWRARYNSEESVGLSIRGILEGPAG